jgi:hypothetical protein
MNKIAIILTLFIFIFLISCGYKPIYSLDSINFKINKITFSETNRLNYKILNLLKKYQQKNDNKNIYDLNIKSEKKITTVSKNSKGESLVFSMEIIIELETVDKNNVLNKNNFIKNYTYNNNDNKFDLNQYEKSIENNLVEEIINSITIYISTI